MIKIDYGHGKLVRDNIPFFAAKRGEIMEYETVQGHDLEMWLKRKLVEEAYEVAAADSDKDLIEEIGDLFEVLGQLALERGLSAEMAFEVAENKREKRGGFEKGIILKSFTRPDDE